MTLYCVWTVACIASLTCNIAVQQDDLAGINAWATSLGTSQNASQLVAKASSIKSMLVLEDTRHIRAATLSHAFLWLTGMLGIIIVRRRSPGRPVAPVWPSSLQRLASSAATTNLPNEIVFKDRVSIAVELAKMEGKCVAVAYLEPLRFPEVSNSMGHDASKKLLWAIGQRLREALRDNDTVAQVDQSQFRVLLPSMAEPSAIHVVARKMFNVFAEPFNIDEYYYVMASIGISVYPTDAKDAAELMAHASAALHKGQQERSSYEIYWSNN
jgi:diguanylate cyclase (GGDEF)-like protein